MKPRAANTQERFVSTSSKSGNRLAFLDWLRGLAAVVMLQGHAFHAFTRPEQRGESLYVMSQFLGGIAPALFLFLMGVTLAFRLASKERLGVQAGGRILAGMRRAGYLLGIAFLFRFQLWLFAWPDSPWTDLLKVDILNCMALAAAVLSLTALVSTADRIRVSAAIGLGIAIASPLVSQLKGTALTGLQARYLAPGYDVFAFFPWAAFVAFGVSLGSSLRVMPAQRIERAMQWLAIAGFALILAARFFADLPYTLYAKSEFWLDSPWLTLIKLGVILLLLAGAYLWNEYASKGSGSWLRRLGTTSLLVYWVHIELVYGRWLSHWKESLSGDQAALAAAGLIVLMIGLSVARSQWASWMFTTRVALRYYFSTARRVSGD